MPVTHVRFSAKLFSACLVASLAVSACGGGGDNSTIATADPSPPSEAPPALPPFAVPPADPAPPPGNPAPDPAPAPPPPATPIDGIASASACSALPALPVRPAHVKSVADFGAVPNDNVDDTAAIQRALDSLQSGEWLVFPAGRYLHSKRLTMKVANTVMWGEGATLHATNASDQAIMLQASGTGVYKFTLTAVTTTRKSTPWESRIAVFAGSTLLSGNVVRGNRVVESGAPGTPLANSAGSAGIFIYHATHFLVAENTVSRSLADAIHVTSGSSYGKVLNNTVKQPGDDMVAVVSYIGNASTPASTVAANFASIKARNLNHHITIAHNNVSGQYWGRGITVVGGENVLIENNAIDRTTHGAAIYLTRETSYLTFGVKDVLVRNNTITDVQTTTPQYVGGSVSTTASKTGHAAVELYSFLFTDEAANATLRDALAVRNIRVENNIIARTAYDGTRIGNGYGRTWSWTGKKSDGTSFTRSITGGQVGLIGFTNNTLSGVGSIAIDVKNAPTAGFNVACSGNTDDGGATGSSKCLGSPPVVAPSC